MEEDPIPVAVEPAPAVVCEEVPHDGLFELQRYGEKTRLRHIVTGEIAPLPDGSVWKIALNGKYAFVHADNASALRANKLLCKSFPIAGFPQNVTPMSLTSAGDLCMALSKY